MQMTHKFTVLLKSIPWIKFFASISDCIADIRYWMITNKLKINDDKTEFLLITSPSAKLTRDIQISIGKDQTSHSPSCKSLGVHV